MESSEKEVGDFGEEKENYTHCRHDSYTVTNSRAFCIFKMKVLHPGNPIVLSQSRGLGTVLLLHTF